LASYAAAAAVDSRNGRCYWSQTAFNSPRRIGIALVTLTDLAFAGVRHRRPIRTRSPLGECASLPWRDWLPNAGPDLPLIERSQFFRLDGARDRCRCVTRVDRLRAFTILAIVIRIAAASGVVVRAWRPHAARVRRCSKIHASPRCSTDDDACDRNRRTRAGGSTTRRRAARRDAP
jgi:hypothetical protein